MADQKVSQLPSAGLPVQGTDLFYIVQQVTISPSSRKVQFVDLSLVQGPNSVISGHLAVFDGTTGKLLKDGGAVPGGSGGPPTVAIAEYAFNRGWVTHVAANFTEGVEFVAVTGKDLLGFKFAFDGFASKTVKWVVYDLGVAGSGSTVLATGTVAVSAAGIYATTLSPALTLVPGHFYTISIYINDGSNLITFGANNIRGWSGMNTAVVDSPVSWVDLANFAAGDAKPISSSGTNGAPIQLTF